MVEETEIAAREGCKRIMVLYGGLHMQVSYYSVTEIRGEVRLQYLPT